MLAQLWKRGLDLAFDAGYPGIEFSHSAFPPRLVSNLTLTERDLIVLKRKLWIGSSVFRRCRALIRHFGKEESHREPHSPGRTTGRMSGVSIELRGNIYRLKSQSEHPADAAAGGHSPYISTGGAPVRCEDWRRGM